MLYKLLNNKLAPFGTGTGIVALATINLDAVIAWITAAATIICAISTLITAGYKIYVKVKNALQKKDFDGAVDALKDGVDEIKDITEDLKGDKKK